MKYEIKLELGGNGLLFFQSLVQGSSDYLDTLPKGTVEIERETISYVLAQIRKAIGETK